MVIFFPSFTNSSEKTYTISHRYCPVEPGLKGRFSDHLFTGKRIRPFLPVRDRKVKLKLNVKIPIGLGEELGNDLVGWVSDQVSNPSKLLGPQTSPGGEPFQGKGTI